MIKINKFKSIILIKETAVKWINKMRLNKAYNLKI